MRVSRSIVFACLTIIVAASPCAAETAPTATSAAAPAEAAPMPPQTAGTLSPNEQKRAERARARAASLSKKAATAPEASPMTTSAASGHTVTRHAAMPTRDASRTPDRRHAKLETRPARRRIRAAALPRDLASGRPPRVGDIVPYGIPLSSTPPGYPGPDRRTAMDAPRAPWPYPLYRPFYRPMVRPGPPPFYGPYYE